MPTFVYQASGTIDITADTREAADQIRKEMSDKGQAITKMVELNASSILFACIQPGDFIYKRKE